MCELRCAMGTPFLDSSKTPYNSGLWCFACRSEFEPGPKMAPAYPMFEIVCVWLICCSYAKRKPWHKKWYCALAMLIVWVEICRKRLQISNAANISNSIIFLGSSYQHCRVLQLNCFLKQLANQKRKHPTQIVDNRLSLCSTTSKKLWYCVGHLFSPVWQWFLLLNWPLSIPHFCSPPHNFFSNYPTC